MERFQGDDGHRLLVDALQEQRIVEGNTAAAERLAECEETGEVEAGVGATGAKFRYILIDSPLTGSNSTHSVGR